MKLLITAATLGVAIAGLILYYDRKSKVTGKIINAAGDAYRTMNEGIASVERPPHHSMG